MAITWLKLHHDVLNDIKLRRFTSQEKWAWVVLLVLASQNKDRGFITADDEDIADACEFNTTQDWLYYRDKLVAKGMVEFSASGLQIVHWDSRQHEKLSDKPEATKERKRRQRAKHKDISEDASRDVTPESRPSHALVTRCHATDTDLDPDLDPEKNSLSLRRFSHSHENPEPEEREVSHSLKEPEAIATVPDFAQAKSNPVKTPNPVENHFSAPPPAPVEKVLPPWRLSWAVDDYDRGFCEDVLRRLQKQWPERVMGDAIAKIYNAERLGKHNQLEADYSSYLNRQNAAPPPLPSALNRSEKLSDAREVGLPQDLSEAIAAIQTKLSTLSWSNQDAARWMKYSGRWTCERGATKALLDGKGAGFARLADDEILMLLDTLSPLNPGQCIPTLQAA